MGKTPRNLAEVTAEEKTQFLASFDTVLLDCDGVLWSLLPVPIDRAEQGVKALEQAEKAIYFLSNNATRSVDELGKKFAKYEIKLDLQQQFITPAHSIVDYLKGINFDKSIYLIGSSVLAEHLRAHNFEVVTGPNTPDVATYSKELRNLAPNVGAVIFDSDLTLNLLKIHRAEMHLLDPNCLLIFGATESEYDLGQFLLSGAGKFQRQLEDKYHRKPIILGKPGKELQDYIGKRFANSRVLFVGDNLETDIGFANKLGFQSLLVFTGCSKKQDMEDHEKSEEIPDYYLDSVAEFANILQ